MLPYLLACAFDQDTAGEPKDSADTADTADTAAPDLPLPDGTYSTTDADLVVTGAEYDTLAWAIDAGDGDGDGLGDLLVAAWGMGDATGGAWMISSAVAGSVRADEVAVPLNGAGPPDSLYGFELAFGDVSGDGLADAVIGSSRGSAGVIVYTGPFPEAREVDADTTQFSVCANECLGGGVAVGDLTGDGMVDLVVAALSTYGGKQPGTVSLIEGPVPQGAVDLADVAAGTIEGVEPAGLFGAKLRVGGDVDGDGNADLLVAATDATGDTAGSGAVYLFHGPWQPGLTADLADAQLRGTHEDHNAGLALAFGDLDGDGRDNIIIGAPGNHAMWADGGVYVFGEPGADVSLDDADVVLTHTDAYTDFGCGVAVADGNEDGVLDLLIGSSRTKSNGAAFVFWGPVEGVLQSSDAARRYNSDDPGSEFGQSVAFHDFDHDGRLDVLAGAPYAESSIGSLFGFHI